jgi:hypothetical protein
MTTDLVRTRAHLADHQALVVGHALAAAFTGLLPLPYVDEWLPSLIRRQLVRRLAEARRVDIDEEAVRIIADGPVRKASWRNLIGATPLLGLLRRPLRSALAVFSVYRRAEGASRTFALFTLFDHYCARQHVGGAIDATAARALRARMDAAVVGAMGSLPAWAVRRAFSRTLLLFARVPTSIAHVLRARRLPPGEVEAEEIFEDALGEAMAREDGVLAQATRSIERQVSGTGRTFVDELVDAFERGQG